MAIRYSDRPIDEAIFAGMLLLACFWWVLEEKSLSHKLGISALSIPFIMILLLAKSRGPQIAFLISMPLVAYCQGFRLKKFLIYFIALAIILLSVLLLSETAKQIFSRGLHFPYRGEIWRASFYESLEYFWFGQGASHRPPIFIDSGEKFNHSHNILLAVFRMGGIVGVLLFLMNLCLCFIAGFKQRDSIIGLWGICLFFGILCLMTNGQYPLTRPTSLWFAYWIPVAFIGATTTCFKIDRVSHRRDDKLRV
nr:O-antigen ligase family protein [Methylomarinum sp. Ch1-1]MDP4522940.1 O-antigen ligase family protein [Methylomarinum sp. Ch1-1]